MTVRLTVTSGTNRGDAFTIDTDDAMLLIGRGDGCDIQLHDPTISRAHCRIGFRDGCVRVADHGSSSGTWVNGEQVTDHALQPGDEIVLGDMQLRFDGVSAPNAQTLPPRTTADEAPQQPDADKPAGEERFSEPGEPVTKPSPAPAGIGVSTLLGRTFETYTLTECVSRVPSGMVFRGTDANEGRDVAVKILHPELMREPDNVRRFLRAVKTMQPIRHKNLVTLYDGGCSDDGYCWCAMEWVEGETAQDAIARIGIAGMLDWRYAIRVAWGVAGALEKLFDNQIVHRNILPRNIFIREKENVTKKDGRVKLGDLILAKALDGVQSERITQRGEIIGELGYLAPEQLAGGDDLDCRSDIYNLGAAVYALLTGRPPFGTNSPATTINAIQNEQPKRPTEFQLSIPPLFEGAVLKMLAKRPDERFEAPYKLVNELERVARYQGLDIEE